MGWAARAHTGARQRDREAIRRTLRTLLALRARIKAGEPLTDADHRILALAKPATLAWLGYEPKVTLAV